MPVTLTRTIRNLNGDTIATVFVDPTGAVSREPLEVSRSWAESHADKLDAEPTWIKTKHPTSGRAYLTSAEDSWMPYQFRCPDCSEINLLSVTSFQESCSNCDCRVTLE